jgi:hypothetical protein
MRKILAFIVFLSAAAVVLTGACKTAPLAQREPVKPAVVECPGGVCGVPAPLPQPKPCKGGT